MTKPPKSLTLAVLESMKQPAQWAIGVGLITALYSLTMPNYYKSEVRLLPVESKGTSSLGNMASAAAAFGISLPGGDGGDANFVDILNSRWLREQLLNTEFQYSIRAWHFGANKSQRKTLYSYLEAKNMDRAIKGVGSFLTVSRDLKSKVISISAETPSPELSQGIVQTATKLLEAFNREKSRTRGGAKAAFAEARLLDARAEMKEAEDAFRYFLEVNRNYQSSSDPGVRLKGTRLETELRLRQQLVTSISLNREQALLEEKNDIPILNTLDPGNLPIDKSKPVRFLIVLLAMVLTGTVSWIWLHRDWVRERLLTGDEEPSPVAKERS